MTEVTHSYVDYIKQGCEAWRSSEDIDGVSYFQKACLWWLDALSQEETNNLPAVHETNHIIIDVLTEVIGYLEDGNIIQATDVLQYELLPLLKPEDALKKEKLNEHG